MRFFGMASATFLRFCATGRVAAAALRGMSNLGRLSDRCHAFLAQGAYRARTAR